MEKLESILLIEDDRHIRKIMALALRADFNVYTAESGERGMAVAAAEQPDLIMLDVRMPVWDGPETLEHLKRNPLTEHIPVILMTASVQQAELEQYKQLDVIGVIDKPFDPILLPTQIRQMAANARA